MNQGLYGIPGAPSMVRGAGGPRKRVPYCRVYSTTNQSCASDNTAILSFDKTRIDTDSMHNPAVHPTRITINTKGFYLLFGHVEWADTTGSPCHKIMQFLLNGTTQLAYDSLFHNRDTLASATLRRFVATAWYLNVGDYVVLRVYQRNNSSLAVNTLTSQPNNHFSQEFGAAWLGD